MVDYLTSLNDPRVGVYYAEAVNGGGYIGEVYGLSEANAAITMNDDVSQRGTAILAADFPGILSMRHRRTSWPLRLRSAAGRASCLQKNTTTQPLR